jgi:hypothetical protein
MEPLEGQRLSGDPTDQIQPQFERILSKLDTDLAGFEELNRAEQTVLLVWIFLGEMDNGGLEQFYFGFGGSYASETIEALERIGAQSAAVLLRKANRVFPDAVPSRDRLERVEVLDDLSVEHAELFEKLDEEFADGRPEGNVDFELNLLWYIEEHRSELPD